MTRKRYTSGFCSGIGVLIFCTLAFPADCIAERQERKPGVVIPETASLQASLLTQLMPVAKGGRLRVPLDLNQTREVLLHTLDRLNIGVTGQDTQQLVTNWILWVHDPQSAAGSSKPRRSLLSKELQRHRFRFNVQAGSTVETSYLEIEDAARQIEVDMTPDSEYSWFEWQDRDKQPGAAFSFLRRLQGDLEATMSTRMLTTPTLSEPALQDITPDTQEANENLSTAEQTAPAPVQDNVVPGEMVVPPLPARIPDLVAESAPQDMLPDHHVTADNMVTTERAGTASVPHNIVADVEAVPPTSDRELQVITVPEETNTQKQIAPVKAAADTISRGLLVNATADKAWPALLVALEELGVATDIRDINQQMLLTDWISSRYDSKDKQWSIVSVEEGLWAFNLRNEGLQKHRFQLIMLPAGNGAQTMIRAYHTGFQEQVDQTPDSSQTLLVWEDRETKPVIAAAFLQRLRIVVRR